VAAGWLFSCSRRPFILLITVVVIGLAGYLGWPHARAWNDLRSARSALGRFDPLAAKESLDNCLRTWPNNVESHLLASRAARQQGDFAEAHRELSICQKLVGGSNDEIALEWALQQASGGAPSEVEEYLQQQAQLNPALAPLVWEALAQGYLRIYRILDAMATLDHWLALDPSNLHALELRGRAYQAGKGAKKAADDFRRVLEMDPTRDDARHRLVICLLDTGGYEEALTNLEYLQRRKPDDLDVQVRVARCYNMLERGDEARKRLDDLLAAHPDHAMALRTRAYFALLDDRPELAESLLRRTLKVWPEDYYTNHLLSQALQKQAKTDEAQAQSKVAEQVKEVAERLGDLRSRKMSERPLDPALHYEMGTLLLRAGHKEVGESWLLSALSLDPNYRPAHAALADYYESQGDATKAKEHLRKAGAGP
jgi:tetratricopeptide (TPR) repeat protein